MEEGESELDTARRETAEETGIGDIRFILGFRERIEYFYKREGQTMRKEVFFFLAETGRKEARMSYEHIGYEWLPYQEALERLTFRNAKEVLEKAENFLNSSLVSYL
jgi:8-oxo-dGTP pyrophosphatase MutT (NUDIX family)